MMEAPKGEDKFSCKVCEKSFPSGPALGGHMRSHFSGDLKRKSKSAYGNEKPENLTPKSKLEEQIALALLDLKKSGSEKKELLEIDIPESEAEEPEDLILTPESNVKDVALALMNLNKKLSYGKTDLLEIHIPESEAEDAVRKSFYLEMRPEDRKKIQGTDSAPEEKDKIAQVDKPVSKLESVKKRKMTETDVSLPDLKRTVYECNTCHRTFGSQQALGGHLSGRSRGRTCLQKDIESMEVIARFNCDGYILKSDVVWAKQRRSGF